MRKHRRKIRRRTRDRKRNKLRKRKSLLSKHLDSYCSNRWTKVTTYLLIIFEFAFVIWWLQDLFLSWEAIMTKLQRIFGG